MQDHYSFSVRLQRFKHGWMHLLLILLISVSGFFAFAHPAQAALPKVAVYGANDARWNNEVIAKLNATGMFSQVANLSPQGCGADATPTLATLQQYAAVLVYSDCGFNNPTALGDVLANYVDGGGRVVVATFGAYGNYSSLGLSGRLFNGGYLPLNPGGQDQGVRLYLVADLPSHPLLAGVTSLDGGSNSYHNTASLASGATLVAHWTNGRPLVAYKGNVVALNFYPPSSDSRGDFWNTATSGARLLANALNVQAPGISVTGNGQTIASGSTTPTTANNTDFGNVAVTGGTLAKTFTLQNSGNVALSISNVTITGAQAGDFRITTQPANSVAAGGQTTLGITFTPNAAGVRSATVTVTSNASTNASYTFAIQGTGTAPSLSVMGNGQAIASGSTTPTTANGTDYGDVAVTGGTLAKTFTLQNAGNAALSISNVTITGAQAGDFRITTQPANSVAAGGQTTLGITFIPGAVGIRSATLTINSNASATPAYTFILKGTGTAPEISLMGNGQTIASGSTTPSANNGTDFGSTPIAPVVRTFTIRNLGNGLLTLGGTPLVAVNGPNASDFAVTQPAVNNVAPGASTTFQVTFTPKAAGLRTALVSIASNTSATPAYTFALQGTGLAPTLVIPALERVVVNDGKLRVPVQFKSNGYAIASLGFVLNYDTTCLSIDPTDADGDGVPDAITGLDQIPVDFVTSVSSKVDSHLLEVALYDNVPPISTLSDRTLFVVAFSVAPACLPAPGNLKSVTVGFASNPAPTFGDPAAKDVAGTTNVGAITLYAEPKPTGLFLGNNSVAENSPAGATVGVFTSTDPDPNATFSYSLVSGVGSDDNASFTIVGNTLKTTVSFDYEVKHTYSIRARTTDENGRFFEQNFTINVTDANDAPTALALSHNSVDENLALGTTVGLFSSTDPDSSDDFIYTLVSGNGGADNASFAIIDNTLVTNAIFDYETKNSYTIRVRTTDRGGLFTEQVFTINVNDAYDAVTGIANGGDGPSSDGNRATFDINENATSGTSVVTLVPSNPDQNNSYTYALVTGNGDTDNGSFSLDSNGLLKTNITLNYETKNSYSIRVRITDSHGQFVEQVLTLNVNDVNEAPTAFTLNNNAVNENSAPGAQVGLFSTSDPDINDTFIYALVSGNGSDDNASFTIVGNTLKTTVAFDYEAKSSYTIRVRTTDHGGFFTEQSFVINVIDVDEPPTALTLSNNRVDENSAVGTPVGVFTTTDIDSDVPFTYTLVSGPGGDDNASFVIISDTLKTAAVFDYETKRTYTIRVRTADRVGLYFEQSFTININDVGEAPTAVDDVVDPRTTVFLGGQAGFIDVLANDIANFGVLSVASVTQPAAGKGSVTNNTTNVSYTAPQANGNTSFTYQASNGYATSNSATVSLSYVANDARGDCNGNGGVTAADFIATVLEIFDTKNLKGPDGYPAWWLSYTGDYPGSPRGCDANGSGNPLDANGHPQASVTAADIICSVLIFFSHPCGNGVQAASVPAAHLTVDAAPAANGAGSTVSVALHSGGNGVAAAAFALEWGNASFDTTDADGDGVPDAVTLSVPAGVSKAVRWNAAAQRLEVVLYGATLPLPLLADGTLVTVRTAANVTPTLTLASLSDIDGKDLLATPRTGVFLPLVVR